MANNTRLLNAPIVLDNGSGTIRAGFAGEDVPKCIFPSYVGRPKHIRAMAGALEGDVFIGPRAQELRGLLKINYPLEHGIVTDWDDMERIWQWVWSEGLKTLSEDVSLCNDTFCRCKILIIELIPASCPVDGTSAESSLESRNCRSNPV
jgi:centractin